MNWQDAWNYITNNQDSSFDDIASALNITANQASDLTYIWSLDDKGRFQDEYEGMIP